MSILRGYFTLGVGAGGACVGALIGLFFGPVGVILGAAIGGCVGLVSSPILFKKCIVETNNGGDNSIEMSEVRESSSYRTSLNSFLDKSEKERLLQPHSKHPNYQSLTTSAKSSPITQPHGSQSITPNAPRI